MLEPVDRSQQHGDGLARLARTMLAQLHPNAAGAAGYLHEPHPQRFPDRMAQDRHGLGFDPHGRHTGRVALVQHESRAVLQCLMQDIAAHGDGGTGEYRIEMDGAVIAHIFAIGPFRLHIAPFIQIAFQDHLAIGRHQIVVGQALDHRCGLAPKRAQEVDLIDRLSGCRGIKIQRMIANGKADGQAFVARDAAFIDTLEVRRCGHIGPGLGPVAQAEPPAAHIAPAGLRIGRVIDGGADIAAAVEFMVRVERQAGEVDIVAGDPDGLDRCFIGRDFDNRLGRRQAALERVIDLVVGCAERRRDPRPPGIDLGHQLKLLRTGFLE